MEEIDLEELLRTVWKKKIQIILITIIFAIFGVIYSTCFITPQYQSSIKLVVTAEAFKSLEGDSDYKYKQTYSELIKSNKIMKTVISNLSLNMTETELRNSITVTTKNNVEVIDVTVKNLDANLAANIANEIAKVFIETIKELYDLENVKLVDEAQVATALTKVNYEKYVIIFAFIGLLISAGYVFIADIIEDKIKSEKNVERLLETQVLATFTMCKRFAKKQYSISDLFKILRTNIQSIKETKTLLITSTMNGEGKTWIASNLATVFAQTGQKVVLIDADMRKKHLDEKQSTGLSSYLKETKEKDIKKYLMKTDIPNLELISSGESTQDSAELLLNSKMESLLEKLKQDNYMVIIDGTSSKLVTDSIILSKIVDSTLMVVGHNSIKEEELQNVVRNIKNAGGNILGVVYNKK